MTWNLVFDNLTTYLLVFVRMAGMILFNPVFARRNVPNGVRMGLILALTLLIAPTVSGEYLVGLSTIATLGAMVMELLVGLLCGMVFQVFYYMLFFAGDLLDVEFGLSMARLFDPGSNIQMSMTSTLLNIVFILYLFMTDSHLIMIKLFSASYMIIPAGAATLTTQPASFYMGLFVSVFSLAIRLALPFVCAIFITEIAMGILMKLVPQIHVFVISVQFKILIGVLLLLLFSAPIGAFIDNYMAMMLEQMEKALMTFAP